MATLFEPTVVILNVWREVRALENALKACQGFSIRDSVIDSIVDAVMDAEMNYTRLLEVVAEIKHSHGPMLKERDLQRLAMATGDLGMAIINDITPTGLYGIENMLPYKFGGIQQGTIYLNHLTKRDSSSLKVF